LSAFPNIQIQDVNLGLGPQFGFAQAATINTYQLSDAVALRIGRNELRFGYDGRRYLGFQSGFPAAFGNYTYSSLSRFLADLPPDVVAQRAFGDTRYEPSQWLHSAFVHDNFTALPNLHFNVGLRYEYADIPVGVQRQQFNSQANAAGLNFTAPEASGHNFGPYAGFAWAPTFGRFTVLRGSFGMYYDNLYATQFSGLFVPQFGALVNQNPGGSTVGFLQNGGVQSPFQGNGIDDRLARRLTNFFAGDQRTPYSMQWNLAWEQAIWRNFSVEFKYLGNRGIHQPMFARLNDPGIVTAQNSLPLFFSAPTQAQLNALPLTLTQLQQMQSTNPLVQAGFTSPVLTVAPDGNSWYHAGSVTLHHRYTGGFQFMGNYTWSHLIDDTSGTLLDLTSNTRQRGNSLYDRRHRASATLMWDMAGAFRNSYSWVRNVVADVTLAGTYTFESPQQLTPLSGADISLSNMALSSPAFFNANGTSGVGSGVTPLTNSAGQTVGYQVNNPNAQFIAGAPGVFINNGVRGGLELGETNNWDISAVKRFSYADRFSFEIRGDAYNIFNHPQFTAGQINSIGFRNPAAVPVFLIPGNPQFGNFQGNLSSNPRMLQLALRIMF